ncbi:MAG: hypothetical protein HY013_13380 [Candidatus Solibacter usitatus]|nr:hypothetical protein [Candidatus Solibacter usitatus]
MTTARVLLIPVAIAMLATTSVAGEKAVGTWADVRKIPGGNGVELVQTDSVRLRGTLVSATDDGLVFRVGGADRSFARASLHSVAVRRRATAKCAAIGLVVGVCLAYPNAKLQGAGVAAGGIVFDTAIGAAIGAAIKSYHTVYRVPPGQSAKLVSR